MGIFLARGNYFKLSYAQVVAIYEDKVTPTKVLAKRYGVSYSCIRDIRCGFARKRVISDYLYRKAKSCASSD